MICTGCNENVHPVQELRANGRGFHTKCPRVECGAPMPEIEHIEVQAPKDEPQLAEHVIPVAPYPQPQLTAPQSAPVQGTDILSMSRARLVQIEMRLAETDKLQSEARKLRAMIAAAEAIETN